MLQSLWYRLLWKVISFGPETCPIMQAKSNNPALSSATRGHHGVPGPGALFLIFFGLCFTRRAGTGVINYAFNGGMYHNTNERRYNLQNWVLIKEIDEGRIKLQCGSLEVSGNHMADLQT